MRISDWSSDVCSSDQFGTRDIARMIEPGVGHMVEQSEGHFGRMFHQMIEGADPLIDRRPGLRKPGPDRKSVVSGKSVSVRVDLGGRRIIRKQTHNYYDMLIVHSYTVHTPTTTSYHPCHNQLN